MKTYGVRDQGQEEVENIQKLETRKLEIEGRKTEFRSSLVLMDCGVSGETLAFVAFLWLSKLVRNSHKNLWKTRSDSEKDSAEYKE